MLTGTYKTIDHTDSTYSSCRETSPSNNPLGSSVILLPYNTLHRTDTTT